MRHYLGKLLHILTNKPEKNHRGNTKCFVVYAALTAIALNKIITLNITK